MDLLLLTTEAFRDGGTLSRVMQESGFPFRHNPAQAAYASHAAKAIAGDGDTRGLLTLLEGETGTGKTLGYLIPIALHIAMNPGRKALVSTYTLHLQHQIIGHEFATAARVVKILTGADIRIAPRKGRQNFPSIARLAELRLALDNEGRLTDHDAGIIDRLIDHASAGGDFQDWSAAGQPMPAGVHASDICLTPGAGPEDSFAYDAHVAASKEADIVVLTHALLLRSCLLWHNITGRAGMDDDGAPVFPYDVAVVDEADCVPTAAEQVFDSRVSVPMVARLAETLSRFGSARVSRLLDEWREWMDGIYTKLTYRPHPAFHLDGAGGYAMLTHPSMDKIRGEAALRAKALSDALLALTKKARAAGLPADDADGIRAVAAELKDFAARCAAFGDEYVPVLRWSPIRAYPSFSIVPVHPGRLAGRLWRSGKDGEVPPYLRSLILTSATLDAPSSHEGARFIQFRDQLGIIPSVHQYRSDLSARFAPDRFGTMRVVLADRRVPAPNRAPAEDDATAPDGKAGTPSKKAKTGGAAAPKPEPAEPITDEWDDTSRASNPDWIAYCAHGIAEAQRRGGRSLVLLPSFRDTEAIAAAAVALGADVITHRRGQKLADLLPGFIGTANSVLLTPSGWEGLNLPGQLSHVIIPRVPFPSPDGARARALNDIYEARGFSEAQARRLIFQNALSTTMRRLRQGIGRGVRQSSDSVTLWILDPRFPVPPSIAGDRRLRQPNAPSTVQALASCIPDRFRAGIFSAYDAAEILVLPNAAGQKAA